MTVMMGPFVPQGMAVSGESASGSTWIAAMGIRVRRIPAQLMKGVVMPPRLAGFVMTGMLVPWEMSVPSREPAQGIPLLCVTMEIPAQRIPVILRVVVVEHPRPALATMGMPVPLREYVVVENVPSEIPLRAMTATCVQRTLAIRNWAVSSPITALPVMMAMPVV